MFKAFHECIVWPLIALSALPAYAADRAEMACLSMAEARAVAVEEGVLPLSEAVQAARKTAPGIIISAELCRMHGNLVYVFALMAEEGRVRRVTIDAQHSGISSQSR